MFSINGRSTWPSSERKRRTCFLDLKWDGTSTKCVPIPQEDVGINVATYLWKITIYQWRILPLLWFSMIFLRVINWICNPILFKYLRIKYSTYETPKIDRSITWSAVLAPGLRRKNQRPRRGWRVWSPPWGVDVEDVNSDGEGKRGWQGLKMIEDGWFMMKSQNADESWLVGWLRRKSMSSSLPVHVFPDMFIMTLWVSTIPV